MKRERLGSGTDGDFRSRGLAARAMLRGELEGPDLQSHVEERQRSLVRAIVRREMGVMATSALVVAALGARAAGL